MWEVCLGHILSLLSRLMIVENIFVQGPKYPAHHASILAPSEAINGHDFAHSAFAYARNFWVSCLMLTLHSLMCLCLFLAKLLTMHIIHPSTLDTQTCLNDWPRETQISSNNPE